MAELRDLSVFLVAYVYDAGEGHRPEISGNWCLDTAFNYEEPRATFRGFQ